MKDWIESFFDLCFLVVRMLMWLFERCGRLARTRLVRSSTRVLVVAALHALFFLGLAYVFLFRVTAGQVGVRQRLFGVSGVVERDYAPGLHPSARWLNAWQLLDARTHVAAFGLSPAGGLAGGPALELRTVDGNLATVSATVLYRIREGEAWRLVADGLEDSYVALASGAVASVLRSELAEMSSDDFASTEARQARMAEALPRLNERLAALHLTAETIQLGGVTFWKEYEAALAAERTERESARVAVAMMRLEQEKRGDPSLEQIDTAEEIAGEEKRIRAEGDRELETLRSQALLEIARVEREAESYAMLRQSEADAAHESARTAGQLLMERAESLRERGLRTALEGQAGRLWLAREAAGKLRVKKAVLNASDPRVPSLLDLDGVVRLLLGEAAQGPR